MKLLVCISVVPDTTTKIKFKDGKELDTTGIQWIINPWDELALTRAIELKEQSGGKIEKVTVIHVGAKWTEPVIRKALAIGADDAIRVDTEAKDSYQVAAEIANAIKDENYDLVFTGLESSDYNGLSVGAMLAEMLNLPSVASVSNVDFNDGKFTIKREIDGGFELLEVATPVVITVQKGIAIEPRIANMRGIMMAKRKPLKVVPAAGVEPLVEFVHFEEPQPKPPCKIVETAEELINLLHNEAKVI